MNNFPKIIISGGGTGGHIFPAVAIANALKAISPNCEILFVGAEGRMEMEKVPAAGYKIVGLNISGIQRGSILKNLGLPFKVISSVRKAMKLISDFKPDAVVGVGGFASGPLLYAASLKKIPYLIQEQNSYAGVTNKLLGKGAAKICVAFDGMEQFFPADKILKTGNPVRTSIVDIKDKHFAGAELLKLDPLKKIILVTGGSLGAGTLNKSIEKHLPAIIAQDVQVIWQTGKFYYKGIIERLGAYHPNIVILEFLNKMDLAYAAADVIISRAGAGTIAELFLIKKPVILVPSPNVAEDHQTKNAMALVKNDAAILINDRSAEDTLVAEALKLLTSKINRVYFVGIGGIGMSALARYFAKRGVVVCGYDKTRTNLTIELEREGILVNYLDEESAVSVCFQKNHDDTLVVYTPAIPKDSKILNHFMQNGFTLKKRSEVLGIISEGMFCIAVAGTHGKTTTSSMIAHILTDTGFGCTAFLGGITSNYNSNVLFGKNNVVVVEADEYDRSFLTLHPDVAVVTSMDADHLDIYGDESHLHESFHLFANQLKSDGKLFVKQGLPLYGITYSANSDSDLKASNIHVENGKFVFDFNDGYTAIKDLNLAMPGKHNVENAVAAIGVALSLGIHAKSIKKAVASFKGVKRRFETLVNTPEHIYIDDYAHHPEELRACFDAVRQLHPDKKLTVLFQPHLFTRTRDFADDFAKVLSTADEVILLEIYPARELPIEGINSKMLLDKITITNKSICGKDLAVAHLKNKNPELLLTVGAGDIDTLIEPLKNTLSHA